MARVYCFKSSTFGVCHRTRGHQGVCATGIGPTFWFAWNTGNRAIGYGYFSHGRFQPMKGQVPER